MINIQDSILLQYAETSLNISKTLPHTLPQTTGICTQYLQYRNICFV